MEEKDIAVVYRFKNGLYINLTNRCPNLCTFCIKTKWAMSFDGRNLNLQGKEPSSEEVIALIRKEMAAKAADEIVFCGYGESTYRLKEMLEIAAAAKTEFNNIKIRLNTVGLGNVINGRNIVPELEGKIDEIFISLNSYDEEQWRALVRPSIKAEQKDVVDFIKKCLGHFKRVVISSVDNTGVDAAKMKAYVEGLGAEFYLRAFLDEE